MDQGQAILQSAWDSGDNASVLLVLADWLEERGDPAAEIIRLVAAEAGTARHSKERRARLKHLRDNAWRTIKTTAWPDMAVQGQVGAVSFSRRLAPDRFAREHIVVRPDRRTIRWLRADVDGGDAVIATRDGRELLRRPLPPEIVEFIASRRDCSWGAGFTLADDFFPLPDVWQQDPESAMAERQRRIDEALAPAVVQMCDLPFELVPYLAWALAAYVWDRRRRARSGLVVPGAHIFVFPTAWMAWRHDQTIENRDAGRAVARLRDTFRTWAAHGGAGAGEGAVIAGLLVRVADAGKITARKLVWVGPEVEVRETANLPRAGDTLPAAEFRRALTDIDGGVPAEAEAAFIADTAEKLRTLFKSEADATVG